MAAIPSTSSGSKARSRRRAGRATVMCALLALGALGRPAAAEHPCECDVLVRALPVLVGHAAGAQRAQLGGVERMALLDEVIQELVPVTGACTAYPVEVIAERIHRVSIQPACARAVL